MSDVIKETESLNKEIEKLKKQNELFATILDHVTEAICAEDENDVIIFYNNQPEIVNNKERSEILGKKTDDVFPHTNILDKNADINWIEWKQKKKPIYNLQYSIHMKEGVEILCLLDIYPFIFKGDYAGSYMIATTPKLLKESQRSVVQRLGQLAPSAKIKHGSNYHLEDIIGQSREIKQIIEMAKRISSRDSTVMLIGETGTGKELFAQGIHYNSSNSQGPFVSVNCAAIPESLLESELFGTIKGAFTGAADMVGLFEYAENGTIFLDEINSMPLPLQAKLLRVVEEKKIRRLGGRKEIPVNCRIISATNANLSNAANTFRSDLLFRLAVVNLYIPPLRERRDDIILLSNYFIQKFNRRFCTSIQKTDDDLQNILINHSWPGNVRELENVIESAMNFVDDDETILKKEHFPPNFQKELIAVHPVDLPDLSKEMNLHQLLQVAERNIILKALESTQWNVTKTAVSLGLSRQNLQNKIKKHGISR